jgi:hypothetical protein
VPRARKKLPEKEGSRLSNPKQDAARPPASLQYLLDILYDVGPTGQGGMGPAPLSHLELLAYQVNMGIRLQPREIRALRKLSAQWIAMSHEAEDPMCPPPWSPAPTPDRLRRVAASLRAELSGGA